MINQIVITDALLAYEGQLVLNPALAQYEKGLLAMKQKWFKSESYTPLSWYASLLNFKPSTLLAICAENLPKESKQYWVASPYHAKLTRSDIRVMPDGMLDWSVKDAEKICDLLNPLLVVEGMKLIQVGEALLLTCDRVWDVFPLSFASISGSVLPNRQPDGKDAGAWMRLLSEIQMTLHQSALSSVSGLYYHGLWFWGGAPELTGVDTTALPHVATNSVYLNSILRHLNKETDASVIVTEADQLQMLMNANGTLPKKWVLLGAGKSVELTSSVIIACLAKVWSQGWKGV